MQDQNFLIDGVKRHMSMSIQDGTRTKYETSRNHFRKFMKMHGYETDVLYIDPSDQDERDFATMFLNFFLDAKASFGSFWYN